MGRYADKKAVVTGGTHGMGLAVVEALLKEGAEVVLTGRNEKNIDEARKRLDGKAAHVVRSDAASLSDVDALGGVVEEKLGRFDFLFVNVGIAELVPFDKVTEDHYDRTFNINTKGAFFTVQRLAPFINEGGAVLFTTSIADVMGYPGITVYGGAKAAVRSFAKGFAAELLPRGVRVNALSPGPIKTPSMGYPGFTEEEKATHEKEMDAISPMKRHGSMDEIVSAALFLAFDATYTTGIELNVDGGLAQGIIAGG
ncbi:SDR family oxidoreductase [Streptomyces marincola]|uniref:SDR family oxidoreductase n=1 Tax=Streptomyces marincola TaxID=2878388 RepID=UPI001CF1955F|nr:SDR family oxidoreductase [Streptomyces marincola]UCM87582.1 SDR family oxidoreductase [Streptomyces marincola]